jgi:hypothetical protein
MGANIAIGLLDVSEAGVRLIIRQPLETGHEVTVGLEPQGTGRPTLIPGVVVWCTALPDGTHCVGIRLEKPLPYDALQTIVRI